MYLSSTVVALFLLLSVVVSADKIVFHTYNHKPDATSTNECTQRLGSVTATYAFDVSGCVVRGEQSYNAEVTYGQDGEAKEYAIYRYNGEECAGEATYETTLEFDGCIHEYIKTPKQPQQNQTERSSEKRISVLNAPMRIEAVGYGTAITTGLPGEPITMQQIISGAETQLFNIIGNRIKTSGSNEGYCMSASNLIEGATVGFSACNPNKINQQWVFDYTDMDVFLSLPGCLPYCGLPGCFPYCGLPDFPSSPWKRSGEGLIASGLKESTPISENTQTSSAKIRPVGNLDLCLSTYRASLSVNARITLQLCTTVYTEWSVPQVDPLSADLTYIRNYESQNHVIDAGVPALQLPPTLMPRKNKDSRAWKFDGNTIKGSGANADMCLEASGTTVGSTVVTSKCNNKNSQKWTYEYAPQNYARLYLAGSSYKCITPTNGRKIDSELTSKLILGDCSAEQQQYDAQSWTVPEPALLPDPYTYIASSEDISNNRYRVLDAQNDAQPTLQKLDDVDGRVWTWEPVSQSSSNVAVIKRRGAANYCLEYSSDQSTVVASSCNNQPIQQWVRIYYSDEIKSSYTISPQTQPQQCLTTARSGSNEIGSTVSVSPCSSTSGQDWEFVSSSSLTSANSFLFFLILLLVLLH